MLCFFFFFCCVFVRWICSQSPRRRSLTCLGYASSSIIYYIVTTQTLQTRHSSVQFTTTQTLKKLIAFVIVKSLASFFLLMVSGVVVCVWLSGCVCGFIRSSLMDVPSCQVCTNYATRTKSLFFFLLLLFGCPMRVGDGMEPSTVGGFRWLGTLNFTPPKPRGAIGFKHYISWEVTFVGLWLASHDVHI